MFSVIVPVYNVEQYLDKCLASILGQTYKDFECIVVDDGSPDNSSAIIDKYVKQDQRFKVIHQKNMGVSAARNAGLAIAQGDYITFVDSDDYISNEYLEKFALKIANTDADIVICGVIDVFKDSQKTVCFEAPSTEVIKQNILADIWPSYPCNKCFKKYLFENIRFPVGKIYEDLLTIPELCISAKKIVCIPDALYYYNRQNMNSITASMTAEKMYALFHGHMKNRQVAELNNIPCLKHLDKKLVKETVKCLLINCNDNSLSKVHEQEMRNYLQDRLDKSEFIGVRNKFWAIMLLTNRKRICAWYARFRSK